MTAPMPHPEGWPENVTPFCDDDWHYTIPRPTPSCPSCQAAVKPVVSDSWFDGYTAGEFLRDPGTVAFADKVYRFGYLDGRDDAAVSAAVEAEQHRTDGWWEGLAEGMLAGTEETHRRHRRHAWLRARRSLTHPAGRR